MTQIIPLFDHFSLKNSSVEKRLIFFSSARFESPNNAENRPQAQPSESNDSSTAMRNRMETIDGQTRKMENRMQQSEQVNRRPQPPSAWKVEPNERSVKEWMKKQEPALAIVRDLEPVLEQDIKILADKGLISETSKKINKTLIVNLQGASWELGTALGTKELILRKVDNANISIMIPRNTVGELDFYAKMAMQYYESEIDDSAEMSGGFEIADEEPMAYLELADLSNQMERDESNHNSEFPSMLAKRYNVYKHPNGRIDGSAEDPTAALTKQIQSCYQNGIRNFYINVYAHGARDRIGFGNNHMLPHQVTEIFKNFPDCRFTMNTVACYGGGLAEEMKDFKDGETAEKGRVNVFTQTKGDIANYDAGTRFETTLYNAALAHYLMQGVDGRPGERLSYGDAHRLADRYAKMYRYTDAEVFSSQPGKKSEHTANNNRPDRFGEVA